MSKWVYLVLAEINVKLKFMSNFSNFIRWNWFLYVNLWRSFWIWEICRVAVPKKIISGKVLRTRVRSLLYIKDYGRLMKPFFNDIPNFWANWVDRQNKLWGLWGIFDGTSVPILALRVLCLWIPSFSCFFYKKFCFSDLT